jgi:hypothetical protein
MPVPDVWHHAVNDHAALERALRGITHDVPGTALQGVEVDVRCCPHTNEVLLSHDALPKEVGKCDDKLRLAEIAAAILSVAETTGLHWRLVLKLDFKDELAGTLVIQGKVPEVAQLVRHPKVEVWGNADLVACDLTDWDVFRHSFPSPILWGHLAAQYFPVLSIGFSRKGGLFPKPFTDADAESMRVALTAILNTDEAALTEEGGTAEKVLRGITLPLQLSSFRSNDGAQAVVRDMLRAADDALKKYHGDKAHKDHHVFLSVWRGRAEWVTDTDYAWLKATFPSCTVDRG